MNAISISAIIGSILLFSTVIFSNRKYLTKKYKNKDLRDLLQTNKIAKRMIKICIFFAFIGPLPLGYFIAKISDKSVVEFILSLIILLIMSSIAMAGHFWQVEVVTEAELEIQMKNNNEK